MLHYFRPLIDRSLATSRRLPKILLMRVPKRISEEVEQRMQVSRCVCVFSSLLTDDGFCFVFFGVQFIARRRLNASDGRRWSRRVNYGSQLLCEIINFHNMPPPPSPPPPPPPPPPPMALPAGLRRKRYPFELQKAIRDIQFIQNHMKRQDEYDAVRR